jgi:hypothetical protein
MIGASETFSATATYANGTTAAVPAPLWSSGNLAILTVATNGQVAAVGPGETAITAEVEGVRGSKTVRAVPRFEGSWQGCWRHLTCTSVPAGGFNFCGGITIGDVGGATLIVSQERDAVSGTLNLSGVFMNVGGPIALDGTLSVSGSRPGSNDAVRDWNSRINGSSLEGTFTWSAVSELTQSGRVLTDELVNMRRVAVLLTPAELGLECSRLR